jgi:glycosyltransferase involved in cell wall biosynthesis
MKINILLFWFVGYDLGEGRTYQKVAEHLAKMPEVARVVVIFPPKKIQEEMYAKPLTIKKISRKLIIIKENEPIFLGFKQNNTILWLFPPHPYLEEIAQRIPHRLLVAHIVDNFEKSDDEWLRKYASAQYPKMQKNADVIITGSKFNQTIFSAGRKQCYLFENAVDEIFIGKPSQLPHLENGTRPRLGYVGTLSDRTDINLMEYLARKKPEWSISIAGHQHIPDSKLECLFKLPNVEYYGHIPYEEVPRFLKTLDVCLITHKNTEYCHSIPRFLKTLDVCLITHKNTEYCHSMSPLKLFQYMASGRPIMATNVPGLDTFKDYIAVAESYDEFIRCLENILSTDTMQKSKARIDIVRGETWERRIQEMFKLVKERFYEKPHDKAPVKKDGFAHSLE